MSFFTDVIEKDLRFGSVDRVKDVDLLEPTMRAAVAAILADAESAGTPLAVTETYRSSQRQIELFNEKKTRLRNVGVHRYGLACDFMKVVPAGDDPWAGDWSFLGELAKAHGLIWGGDWGNPSAAHSFRDYDHVQRCALLDQPGLFEGTWYPDDSYDPWGGAR